MEEIAHILSVGWNQDSCSEAKSSLLALSQFSFHVNLVLAQRIVYIAHTGGLALNYKVGINEDAPHAHKYIESLNVALKGTRSQVDNIHYHVYEEAVHITGTIGIEESTPHLACQQQQHSFIPTDPVMDSYKQILPIQLWTTSSVSLITDFTLNCLLLLQGSCRCCLQHYVINSAQQV